MMDMSCADRDGGTLLLRDIQSFNEFWKQMVPPKETQVDCCPYTCTQYNQFLFAPDGKFHTVGPTHYNTFLQVGKKSFQVRLAIKNHLPSAFLFFSRTRKRQIGCKKSAPVCFLQCFTFFNVPIKWGCNILLV